MCKLTQNRPLNHRNENHFCSCKIERSFEVFNSHLSIYLSDRIFGDMNEFVTMSCFIMFIVSRELRTILEIKTIERVPYEFMELSRPYYLRHEIQKTLKPPVSFDVALERPFDFRVKQTPYNNMQYT